MTKNKIGIFGPASVIPPVELKLGLERLKTAGFEPKVHALTKKKNNFWAGSDEERVREIIDFATDDSIDTLWCARGGYGSARLLDHLRKSNLKPRKKLLVGFSDLTALYDFVQNEWDWSVLHAPMPATRHFLKLSSREWGSLQSWVRGQEVKPQWNEFKLKMLWQKKLENETVVSAPLVGGNLSVLMTLLGTRDQVSFKDKIVFLEDVDEPLYRLDRMVNHAVRAGIFEGARAIVLGTFHSCRDYVLQVLKSEKDARKKTPKLVPVRKEISTSAYLNRLWASVGECVDVPVFTGLPVGHGDVQGVLPIGGHYEISSSGSRALLTLKSWDWLDSSAQFR